MITSWVWLDRTGFFAAVLLGQITVVVALAVLAARLFGRGGAAARHAVWLAALSGVLAAPLLTVLVEPTGLSLGRIEGYATDSGEEKGNGVWTESPYLPVLAPVPRASDGNAIKGVPKNKLSSETIITKPPMPVVVDTPPSAEDEKSVTVETGKPLPNRLTLGVPLWPFYWRRGWPVQFSCCCGCCTAVSPSPSSSAPPSRRKDACRRQC